MRLEDRHVYQYSALQYQVKTPLLSFDPFNVKLNKHFVHIIGLGKGNLFDENFLISLTTLFSFTNGSSLILNGDIYNRINNLTTNAAYLATYNYKLCIIIINNNVITMYLTKKF